jgi:hypothetical protein
LRWRRVVAMGVPGSTTAATVSGAPSRNVAQAQRPTSRRKISHLLPGTTRNNLAGDLGLTETADIALKSANQFDPSASFTAASTAEGSFGATIQFSVVRNLNTVGPTWTLVHFTGPGGFAGINRTDTHEIVFAFMQGTGTTAQQKAHNHTQNLLLRGIEQRLLIGPIQ